MFNQMVRNIEYGLMVAVSTIDNWKVKKVCPVCQKEVSYYKPYGIKLRMNAECPYCKAAERDRIEVLYYRSQKNIFRGGAVKSSAFCTRKMSVSLFYTNNAFKRELLACRY